MMHKSQIDVLPPEPKPHSEQMTMFERPAKLLPNTMLAAGSFSKQLPPNEKVMALSWKQPFAELMLHEKMETRTWHTKYRGWVLICASKQGYNFNQVHAIAGDKQIVRITDFLGRNNDHWLQHYRSGIAIAIGKLVDCRKMKKEDEDKCFVSYTPNLFCHLYENVKEISPLAWKGCQGWKQLSENDKLSIIVL